MSKNSAPRRYRFAGDYPIIFTDLEIGKNVAVERAQPNVDYTGEPVEAPSGSTLVLRPGDIITPTADSYEHAWLVEIDAAGEPILSDEPAPAPVAETVVDTAPVSTDPSALAEGTNLDKKDGE